MVESKKCLGGQKRSRALLVRVCCCLLCISNLPWASRPTPLKTFEQHLAAALWGLGRGGLSPFSALGVLSPGRALSLSLSFHYIPFLALPTVEGPSLPLPGPLSPPWQTTRFLPLSMFVIGSSESLPCSCSPVKDLSLSLPDTAPSRNHQQTRGSFLDSLFSFLNVPCSLWHPSSPFLHCDSCQSRDLSPTTATHCLFAFPGELEVIPSCHPPPFPYLLCGFPFPPTQRK